MENALVHFEMVTLSPLLPETKNFLLLLYCEKLVGFLEVKPMEAQRLPQDISQKD
jgi:hypothetical protein